MAANAVIAMPTAEHTRGLVCKSERLLQLEAFEFQSGIVDSILGKGVKIRAKVTNHEAPKSGAYPNNLYSDVVQRLKYLRCDEFAHHGPLSIVAK